MPARWLPFRPSWALRLVAVAAVLAALIATCSRLGADEALDAADGETPPLRTTMSEIFAALRVVAPAAYGEKPLQRADGAGSVPAALLTLSDSTSALQRHARSRDPGFAYLAGGLSERARTASRLVAAGRDGDARRIVRGMIDQCVACHARVPSANDFALGRELLGEIDVEALPLRQRAQLEVATRQFESALTSYEKLLASSRFANAGAPDPSLVRYLAVCLSVEGDRTRATATLDALRARPGAGKELREDLATWTRSIAELSADEASGPRLQRARALLARSGSIAATSPPRRALIFDLEARLELQHFLDEESELSVEVAEAYYLMGRVEERIWDRPWLSNAGPFYEASIRLGPRQAFARDAYERLERILVLGYTGSSGTRLPEDVQERLRELDETIRSNSRS